MEICRIISFNSGTGFGFLDTDEYSGRKTEGDRWTDNGTPDGVYRNTDDFTDRGASLLSILYMDIALCKYLGV